MYSLNKKPNLIFSIFFKIYIVFLIMFLLFNNCGENKKIPPKAKLGVIDLRDWDFDVDGVVNLEGDWEFYWKEFLSNKEILETKNLQSFGYIKVPDSWNNNVIGNEKIEGRTFGTYKLKILINPNHSKLGLRNLYIATAYKLIINDGEIASSGKIGKSKESYEPKTKILLCEIPNNSELNLILQVSNFYHNKGGLRRAIKFGKFDDLVSDRNKFTTLDLILAGSLLIMGFYHIFIYFLRRDDKSNFYFGVFCSLMFLRILFSGELIISTLFDNISYGLLTRIEYISIFLGLPIFILYIYYSYKNYISKKVLIGTIIFNIPSNYMVFFGDIYYLTKILFIYEIYTILTVIVSLLFLVYLIKKKEYDAIYLLSSGIIFAICVINDILYNLNLIDTTYSAPYGFFVVIFAQSILISVRYTNALRNSEDARKFLATKEIDLIHSKMEVEKLSKTKDIFISNLSHEIKTPLSYVYGYSEILKNSIQSEQDKEYFVEIYQNISKLNDYINDLILLTEIDSDIKLNIIPSNLSSMINNLILYYKSIIELNNIKIINNVNSEISINCDHVLMYKAIGNIIKNSILYNKKNGEVEFNFYKKDNSIFISIKDTGIGISTEYYQKVFEKFYRLNQENQYEVQGVGVGLYISEKVISMHKGEIILESSLNIGSNFIIKLKDI
jgi:two-component system, sensor histidine kinase ChiS